MLCLFLCFIFYIFYNRLFFKIFSFFKIIILFIIKRSNTLHRFSHHVVLLKIFLFKKIITKEERPKVMRFILKFFFSQKYKNELSELSNFFEKCAKIILWTRKIIKRFFITAAPRGVLFEEHLNKFE